jgi:UDP-N-acetylmuramate dehydrogenase
MTEIDASLLLHDEPMARHVSWRAGGAVRRAFFPHDLEALANFLRELSPDEPLLMVGLGSNLLVRDGGFAGTAIFTHGPQGTQGVHGVAGQHSRHGGLSVLRCEDGEIYAEAGVASPKLARFAANHEFAEAEFFAGIPGTVGGALAMNAGCHGGETWRHVSRVLLLDRSGRRVIRQPDEFEIGYRHVVPKVARDEMRDEMRDETRDEIFAAAWFRFPPGDKALARQRIRELLARRIATQPLKLPNAGSVFRNPPGDHAARLIEAAGLKGAWMGAAQVSEMHANFIVNPEGKATASEIEMLMEKVQRIVAEKFGVQLVREVRIVGEHLVGGGA